MKKFKKNFETIIYDLDGLNQDGFNRKGFDRNGFNINGTDEHRFSRNKALACREKVKRFIRENPWNICFANEVFRNKYEIMKECVESDSNTYQYSTLALENKIVDPAIFFLERGGSFSLISKHLRNNKQVERVAVRINPNNFQ